MHPAIKITGPESLLELSRLRAVKELSNLALRAIDHFGFKCSRYREVELHRCMPWRCEDVVDGDVIHGFLVGLEPDEIFRLIFTASAIDSLLTISGNNYFFWNWVWISLNHCISGLDTNLPISLETVRQRVLRDLPFAGDKRNYHKLITLVTEGCDLDKLDGVTAIEWLDEEVLLVDRAGSSGPFRLRFNPIWAEYIEQLKQSLVDDRTAPGA